MLHRFLTSIVGLSLVACAGSSQVREPVSQPRSAPSKTAKATSSADARKAAAPTAMNAKPEPTRDAKSAAVAEIEEDEWPAENFAGVDTTAPVDDENAEIREVAVKGIEGTTSEYDVRTTLDNRAADFDLCHDRVGGSGGRLVFRIHILANGDVGGVKVRRLKVRNTRLVECYTEVVSSSHFNQPHGGYADVKWTTKVGRSRKRPDALFERRGRWDTPAGSSARSEGRRRRGRS